MSDIVVPADKKDPIEESDPLVEIPGLRGVELVKKSQIKDLNLEDDPIVEIPGLGKVELAKKSQIKGLDTLVVRCTGCLEQVNHLDSRNVKRHRKLNVIVCKECYEFYGSEEFSCDEAGNYNYCTWCGNGGKLFLCDFCPNVYCMNCIRRNIGRAEVAIMQKDGWKCYVCDPSKIKAKVNYCNLIMEFSKKLAKSKKKEPEPLKNKDLISEVWVLEAFTKTDTSCKNLQKKMDRLKNVEASRSKSLKHIIKKMEEIVSRHKVELSNVMRVLSQQYSSYITLKQAEEKLKKKVINASSNHLVNSNNENGISTVSLISDSDDNKIKDEKSEAEKSPLKKHQGGIKDENDQGGVNDENDQGAINDENDQGGVNDENNKPAEMKDDVADHNKTGMNGLDTDVKCNLKFNNLKEEKNSILADDDDIEISSKMNLLNDSSDDDLNFDLSDFEKPRNITVTAEIHSSELQDSDLENTIKKRLSKVAKSPVKKPANVILENIDDIQESPLSSLSDTIDDFEKNKKGNKKSKLAKKKDDEAASEIDYINDTKLRLPTTVVLKRCDDMLNGETSIKVPAIFLVDERDKVLEDIMKEPVIKKKAKRNKDKLEESEEDEEKDDVAVLDEEIEKDVKSEEHEKIDNKLDKQETKKAPPKKRHSSSSSSIVFSSDEDLNELELGGESDKAKSKIFGKKDFNDPEEEAKKKILDDSDDDDSICSLFSSEGEKDKKETKKKSSKKNDSSSDDFQPKKKKKLDKLLTKRICSDNEEKKKSDKKGTERKKKRRLSSSGEEFQNTKEKSSNSATSDSDSNNDLPKSKKRRRIKKPAASSSDEKEKKTEETPKKGRKDIQKIIHSKDLKQETKDAQQAEKERIKRIEDKQKLYNVITDKSKDGCEVVTKKLVLEVDPVSKEELVEIHSDLIEKLKPHQVKGVQFMWECTIESLEALSKEKGSGCILAHCMGLGKTLQVITFLHTCLTNPEVNKYIKSAMVICPYNTVLNWSKEVDQWLSNIDSDPILLHEVTFAKDNYERLDIIKYWKTEGGILIISYELFRRLASSKIPKLKKKDREKLHSCLLDPGPDIVVCDEGHILKNENSAVSKACNQLNTARRIVLTGTPLQNNLKEYHCMLSFVKPHLLGTNKEFRNRFVNPIVNGQYEDSTDYDVRKMKKRIHILHKLLDGCVQRCDYTALTKFLPPKSEYVISVKLSETQINMYRWYLENMSKAKAQVKIQGGTLFQDYNTLRNICLHPYIVHTSFVRAEKNRESKMITDDEEEYDESFIDDGSSDEVKVRSGSGSGTDEVVRKYKTRSKVNDEIVISDEEVIEKKKEWYHEFISEDDASKVELSGKMVLLMNILKECESIGDKVIVFSQSLLTLNAVETILDHAGSVDNQGEHGENFGFSSSWIEGLDYFRMDGSTSAEHRKQFIDMFNNPSNPRARLFLVSTRAGGLGTNLVGANRVVMLDASWNPSHDVQAIFRVYRFGQKKPVYIYRLLAQGTMEEKIYDRQVTKLSLSIRVVDEQQIDRHFNSSELSELYNFEPDSQTKRPIPVVPNDRLLAEMLIKYKDLIVTYHEHDSLLQNETEEDLTEEERKAAWVEYENEREGRSAYDISIDEEIAAYCKEPDFDQADYDTPVLPSAKVIVDDLLNKTRLRCTGQSVQNMRRALLTSINLVKAHFQEIHVKVLRMKQEYVAKGSVPATVNKYLDELSSVITNLKQHYDRLYQMIVEEDRKAQMAAAQAQFQRAQFQNIPNMVNMPRGYQARFPFVIPPQTTTANSQPFTFINQANLNRMQNRMGNATRFVRMPSFTTTNVPPSGFPSNSEFYNAFNRNSTTTSQPVITVAEDNTGSNKNTSSNNSGNFSSAQSSVVIEEIE